MKLDLEEMEQRPTNKIPGFRERVADFRRQMSALTAIVWASAEGNVEAVEALIGKSGPGR